MARTAATMRTTAMTAYRAIMMVGLPGRGILVPGRVRAMIYVKPT
jgi:hypothetical protein